MNADGSNVQQITDNPGFDGIPKWSPDGETIAFNSSRTGNPEVFIFDVKSQMETRLTTSDSADFIQDWQQNQLLIRSDRSGKSQIYVITLPEKQLNMIPTENAVTYARFAEAGKRIVFITKSDSGEAVFLMNADSSNLAQVTGFAMEKRYPLFIDREITW